MSLILKPLKTESLVEIFIRRFEELILSEKITIGEKLPSERELALRLGVSRSVVHEGLIELETRGLVEMKPRSGATVKDYRRNGSLTLLNSLVQYSSGTLGSEILDGMLKLRELFETETAALSAINRNDGHISEFKAVIENEKLADRSDIEKIVSLDFSFHLIIALSSGNLIYPLLLNSFKKVYTNLTGIFFRDSSIVEFVFNQHEKLFKAIEKKDHKAAAKVMKAINAHGEEYLKMSLSSK